MRDNISSRRATAESDDWLLLLSEVADLSVVTDLGFELVGSEPGGVKSGNAVELFVDGLTTAGAGGGEVESPGWESVRTGALVSLLLAICCPLRFANGDAEMGGITAVDLGSSTGGGKSTGGAGKSFTGGRFAGGAELIDGRLLGCGVAGGDSGLVAGGATGDSLLGIS